MNGETPKFNFLKEKNPEIYSATPTFFSLLMKSYENKTDVLLKRVTEMHLSEFSKMYKENKKNTPTKKIKKDTSEPKGQFEKFLEKRFNLRNDYDKQHVDEFLSSKELAFEFPSRNGDIIE